MTCADCQVKLLFLYSRGKMLIVFLFFVVFGEECIDSEENENCEEIALNKLTKCNLDCPGIQILTFFRIITYG